MFFSWKGGRGGKYSHWGRETGTSQAQRAAARIKAPTGLGQLGRPLVLNPPPRPVLTSPHPGVELTISIATFSFSTERPFRGAVTATPSSSAFLRSSSIS